MQRIEENSRHLIKNVKYLSANTKETFSNYSNLHYIYVAFP